MTIACEALHVRLGQRRVLNGISLAFEPGKLVGIIGPNGAGKSTLLRAMLGLAELDEGNVSIDGADLGVIPRRELAQRIAYLPQSQTVHWPISVERLVSLGRLPHLAPMSKVSSNDAAAIERAMVRANVEQFRTRTATELSGGERARVMLARALAVEARGLIVDEPLAALDPGHQIDVMELLKREAAAGLLVIVVLHDLTTAARYCDRLVLLDSGKVVDDGAPNAVLTAERLAAVYGITARIEHGDAGSLIVPTGRLS